MAGHSLSNMTIAIIEKVKGDEEYRNKRETHLIRKFNTFFRGLDRQPQYKAIIHLVNNCCTILINKKDLSYLMTSQSLSESL